MSNVPGNVALARSLMAHPAFAITNPNNCYSLFLGFARSPVNFHAADGSGYEFMADAVLKVSRAAAAAAAGLLRRSCCWRETAAAEAGPGGGAALRLARGCRCSCKRPAAPARHQPTPVPPPPPTRQVDKINNQVAARMVGAFTTYKQYDAGRQALMRAALERISQADKLSENVFEIVSKSLQ
jgi:aminopeptidase N